jgi:hypothetical protein
MARHSIQRMMEKLTGYLHDSVTGHHHQRLELDLRIRSVSTCLLGRDDCIPKSNLYAGEGHKQPLHQRCASCTHTRLLVQQWDAAFSPITYGYRPIVSTGPRNRSTTGRRVRPGRFSVKIVLQHKPLLLAMLVSSLG